MRELVADDYHDGDDRDADDLRRDMQGYLIAHQSIHLITRIDVIEIKGTDVARVRLTVGVLGRDSASTWDLAADIHRFDLRLAREGGEWRVTRAGWWEKR